MKYPFSKIFVYSLLLMFTVACQENYTPKPRAYYRINLPDNEYTHLQEKYPYQFQYSTFATIEKDDEKQAEPYWINIHYKELKAKIHISYKTLEGNPTKVLEDAHKLAFNHYHKADAINEKEYSNPKHKTYGILYEIKGNAASPVQFYLTDSTKHFLRGSLYFFTQPNKDSLAPVTKFIKEDIIQLMESLKWTQPTK